MEGNLSSSIEPLWPHAPLYLSPSAQEEIHSSQEESLGIRSQLHIVNIEAYNDATKKPFGAASYLGHSGGSDAFPLPAIVVDIQSMKSDLEQKVKELGLEKQQIAILINPSRLEVFPQKLCYAE